MARDPFGSKKRAVLVLRWTVVLGGSFLALSGSEAAPTDPRVLAFVGVFLASHLAASAVPVRAYEDQRLLMALVLFDTLWIGLGTRLAGAASSDLFLLYFAVLFVAALGESVAMIAGGCVLVALLHAASFLRAGDQAAFTSPAVLLRFPFLLGLGTFYGYLVVHEKREQQASEAALREADLRSDLAASITHDLQTPVSAIVALADVLLDEGDAIDPATRRSFLASIRSASLETSELVSSFLAAVANRAAPRGGRTLLDLDEVVGEALEHHRRRADEKGIRLDVSLAGDLPRISGNRGELRRAVSNLVGNAVKFVPPGGTVGVVTTRLGSAVAVSVADDGPGLPEAVRERLFEPYGTDGGPGSGTGLGLYIVRWITESHGGSVTIRSTPGRGCRFVLRFPLPFGAAASAGTVLD